MEGKRILLPAKGHLQNTLTEMEQDLQECSSYAGGRSWDLDTLIMLSWKNIWNRDASHFKNLGLPAKLDKFLL